MKNVVLLFIFICSSSYSQNYLNNDGTMSDFAKRQFLIAGFKDRQTDDVQYDSDGDNFVIITKYDCGTKKYDSNEMQKQAMIDCFDQLHRNISSLKTGGYNLFSDIGFKGIVFKTNSICMFKTRRYHFKFTFEELNEFPEYMDFEELFNYVVIQNENKNIILVKNER